MHTSSHSVVVAVMAFTPPAIASPVFAAMFTVTASMAPDAVLVIGDPLFPMLGCNP